jgi:hypothetical protein
MGGLSKIATSHQPNFVKCLDDTLANAMQQLKNPSPDFITHYSGRVVANLAEPSGAHMQCQFQLVHPSDGMNGGGLGQCQLTGGTTIDANFPKG